ncbi:(2Fe-2S)-binding protein [Jannaschia sp. Os4]|uniref:(2Fe-2S)-binding protein n=1 Tax=Jannaschia sp. Os4 TaxID=2807617 RepID=UPI00193A8891|nr:(2Fe-2S)-binding protein [Jannaschia sp. Os4]MBM2576287.1 (2Fe-2S)-binding protein [Jannaschia sp. Os4]
MTRRRASDDGQRGLAPSRRGFLTGTAAAAGGLTAQFAAGEAAAQEAPRAAPGDLVEVTFTLNGAEVTRAVDPRRTALDLLREGEGLTGTKVGCRHGQCGACTLHVDGRPVLSCLTLAAQLEGAEVTTIEGLADAAAAEGIATADGLHPVQRAFIERDGFQCGYCTPGQIMSAAAVIAEGHASSEAEVREYMSGNLCRCAAYPQIVAAVMDATAEIGTPQDGGGARADYHLGLVEQVEDEA